MTRTQIQLPDELYRQAKRVAAQHEVSLAELCRRGLEYMLAVYPAEPVPRGQWEPPTPRHLGGQDPFADDSWREDANLSAAAAPLLVREKPAASKRYGKK